MKELDQGEIGALIAAETLTAVADAAFDASEVAFYLCRGDVPDSGEMARWSAPEVPFDPPSEAELLDLDVELVREPHRIAIWTHDVEDISTLVATYAKLRHELEHACQWHAHHNAPFSLSHLTRQILGKIPALHEPWGRIVNLIPLEQDANAASALYVSRRYPDHVDALLSSERYAPLVRLAPGLASSSSLITRMVAFLFAFEPYVEGAAREDGFDSADVFIDAWAPGAGDLWRHLATP